MDPLAPTMLQRLRDEHGGTLLAAAVRALDAGEDTLRTATRLRTSGADPDLVAAALSQAALRRRGRAKFGADADRMFFTAAGLEQATRTTVATHRATRFAARSPGVVADLCCGIGGDLVALARAGVAVVGLDRDPLTVATARANIEALGLSPLADADEGDVTSADLARFDAAFLDPSRRSGSGRRTFDPAAYSPPFSFVADLVDRVPASGVKVAPGIPHDLVPPGAEAEWVSDAGDVKEAALWFGPLVTDGVRRRATLLPSGATVTHDPTLGAPPVGPVGRWLHEPDGAVVRAGLVAEVATMVDGRLLDPAIAYVTSDRADRCPFTRRFAVELIMPFQLKRLRAMLREQGVGDVVVKKRGIAIEPEELRRRLRLDGRGPTRTLVLTRIGADPFVVLCDPAP